MPPTFNTVHTSAMTWSEIQKDLYFSLEQELVSSDNLKVLNRNKLKTAMSELKIAASDLTGEESASKVGKMMVADWVLLSDVKTFEVSHARRKLAMDNGFMQTTNLQLELNYRIIDVATQQVLLSDRYQKTTSSKPKMMNANQGNSDQVSIRLAQSAIPKAATAVANSIGSALFGIEKATTKQIPAPSQQTAIQKTKPPSKPKPALNDDDW